MPPTGKRETSEVWEEGHLHGACGSCDDVPPPGDGEETVSPPSGPFMVPECDNAELEPQGGNTAPRLARRFCLSAATSVWKSDCEKLNFLTPPPASKPEQPWHARTSAQAVDGERVHERLPPEVCSGDSNDGDPFESDGRSRAVRSADASDECGSVRNRTCSPPTGDGPSQQIVSPYSRKIPTCKVCR